MTTHGGKREGAGRPPITKIKIMPAHWQIIGERKKIVMKKISISSEIMYVLEDADGNEYPNPAGVKFDGIREKFEMFLFFGKRVVEYDPKIWHLKRSFTYLDKGGSEATRGLSAGGNSGGWNEIARR